MTCIWYFCAEAMLRRVFGSEWAWIIDDISSLWVNVWYSWEILLSTAAAVCRPKLVMGGSPDHSVLIWLLWSHIRNNGSQFEIVVFTLCACNPLYTPNSMTQLLPECLQQNFWWHHGIYTLSALLALCEWNLGLTVLIKCAKYVLSVTSHLGLFSVSCSE